MRPLVWGLFKHAWKTENIQTVDAQPYLRCLARAISLPHSNRQSCNMNMQFYDHSGETHVHTRASYAFPRSTSPGLFSRKVTNIRRRAQSAPRFVHPLYVMQSAVLRGKFRNSFLEKWQRAARSSRSSLNTYVDSGSKHTSLNLNASGKGTVASHTNPAFAANYSRNIREKCKRLMFSVPFDKFPLNYARVFFSLHWHCHSDDKGRLFGDIRSRARRS